MFSQIPMSRQAYQPMVPRGLRVETSKSPIFSEALTGLRLGNPKGHPPLSDPPLPRPAENTFSHVSTSDFWLCALCVPCVRRGGTTPRQLVLPPSLGAVKATVKPGQGWSNLKTLSRSH